MCLVLGALYEVILSGVSLFSVVPLPNFRTSVIIILVAFFALKVIVPRLSRSSGAKFGRHIIYSLVSSGLLVNFFVQFFVLERSLNPKGYVLIFSLIWLVAMLLRTNKYWSEWLRQR